MKAYWGLEV